MNKQG